MSDFTQYELEPELALIKQKLEAAEQDRNGAVEQFIESQSTLRVAQLHIKELREALINTAGRKDGDGRDCWCSDDLRSGLFANKHAPYCLNAREAIAKQPDTRALDKALLEAEIKVLSAMQSAKRFGQGTYDRGEISFMITTREAKLAELIKTK